MSGQKTTGAAGPGAGIDRAREAIERFRSALGARSIIAPPEIIADGRIHRCDAEGKNGKGDASYLLHLDGIPAGGFENWRDGQGWEHWCLDIGRALLPLELDALRDKAASARREREAQRGERHAAVRSRARRIWERARTADKTHPYLARKEVSANGLRVYKGALVVPLCDAAGDIHSLQFISVSGDKRFLKGGRVAGLYYLIGRPKGTVCIAEGYATAASIHAATGHAVAVAFNASNLQPVGLALREKYPGMRMIFCADDDAHSERNVGVDKACDAARVIGGLVAVPNFGADRPEYLTDFNDLATHCSGEAVARAIANATAPAGVDIQPAKDNAAGGESAGCIAYRRASEIEARPIHWLWPNRIARGKVSMIAGNPGLGKSQLTVSMAAVVSTGSTWPIERTPCERGNVILLSAEDDPEDTIRPRLEAAGADLSRVFILGAVVEGYRADGGEVVRAFNLKTDLTRLGALLAEIADVAMVVIDPISAYLGDTNSHNNAEIRALLSPLSELAAQHGAAVVCVSHLNKSAGDEALMRVTGSTAFVAAARAAFIVVKDRDNEARRLLLPLKNNIGNDQTGLAFSLQSAQVRSPVGLVGTSCVVWEPGAVTVTADEAMIPQGDPEERSEMEDAKGFLRDLLTDGPVASKRIRADSQEAGYSWATVRRAQKALGIGVEKDGLKGGWAWRLSLKVLKKAEGAHPKSVSIFGKNEHLREPAEGNFELVEVEI